MLETFKADFRAQLISPQPEIPRAARVPGISGFSPESGIWELSNTFLTFAEGTVHQASSAAVLRPAVGQALCHLLVDPSPGMDVGVCCEIVKVSVSAFCHYMASISRRNIFLISLSGMIARTTRYCTGHARANKL